MVADRVIFVCTIVVAAVYLWATTLIPSLEIGDPLGPKAFPRLLGIGLLIAAGLLLLEMIKDRKQKGPKSVVPLNIDWPVAKMIVGVTIWTGVYYVAFQPLGYMIATTVYLLGLMAWFHRGHWVANVLTAVLFGVGSYIMFVTLDVNLPRGVEAFSWFADGVHAVLDAVVGVFKGGK
jgi:putative tricarboxylic transport membrane protein